MIFTARSHVSALAQVIIAAIFLQEIACDDDITLVPTTVAPSGSAGVSGSGAAGSAGDAGVSGRAGSAGSAGSGRAGAGGSAAAGGSGGASGTAGASGSSGTSGSGGGPTFEQACIEEAERFCEKTFSCLAGFAEVLAVSPSVCVSRLEQQCMSLQGAPGLASDVAIRMSSCAVAFAGAACEVLFSPGLSECQIRGALIAGAACSSGMQCETGYCAVHTGETCGICEPLLHQGGPCDLGLQNCDGGLHCDPITSTCVQWHNAGDICADENTCFPTLVCHAGVCQVPTLLGEPCSPSEPTCAQARGEYCDPVTLTCRPYVVSPPGGSCAPMAADRFVCSGDAACDGSFCQPRHQDGDGCTADQDCVFPARCAGGQCQLTFPSCSN